MAAPIPLFYKPAKSLLLHTMPWLSRSPSPKSSPRRSFTTATSPSVTYIPPLVDGACGTVPQAQKGRASSLWTDVQFLVSMLPELCRRGWQNRAATWRMVSWREVGEFLTQLALSAAEMSMLASVVPLWLCLPGVLFFSWVMGCAAMIMGASWLLEGSGPRIIRCAVGLDSWMMGQDVEDEKWIFLGGLGQTYVGEQLCTPRAVCSMCVVLTSESQVA